MDLPTLDDIPDPEIPELPPEPSLSPKKRSRLKAIPNLNLFAKSLISRFQKTNPITRQRVPERKPQTRRNNDLSREVDRLRENLNQLPNQIALPQTAVDSLAPPIRIGSTLLWPARASVLNSIEIHR